MRRGASLNSLEPPPNAVPTTTTSQSWPLRCCTITVYQGVKHKLLSKGHLLSLPSFKINFKWARVTIRVSCSLVCRLQKPVQEKEEDLVAMAMVSSNYELAPTQPRVDESLLGF
ncbi:hypothetical protein OIU84_030169 [Salix udensis]|uniref:Uncharacterized protein n=1 Tax=Salix udensis TaxID=889485 RepID=A0AAD6P8S4_9ROSI|nr:hypothetical protein OIU84_030169 [Salix udensis]